MENPLILYFSSDECMELAEKLMSTKTWDDMTPAERCTCLLYTIIDSKDMEDVEKRLRCDLGIKLVTFGRVANADCAQNSSTCIILGELMVIVTKAQKRKVSVTLFDEAMSVARETKDILDIGLRRVEEARRALKKHDRDKRNT
ncbi:hypothetical protein ACFL6I_25025 [candidate division KSB1 bacterium]